MEGYDNEFVPTPDSRYECPICYLILREPYQTKCGHMFCRDCIMKSLRDTTCGCPMDHELLEEADIYPDNFAKREILNFNIKCPNNKDGCDQIFPLKKLENHLEECSFAVLLCPYKCDCKMLRCDVNDHITSSCENRTVACEHCNSGMQAKDLENHLLNCPKIIIACLHCGEKKVRTEMPCHIQKECHQVIVHCPFYLLGCSNSMKRSLVEEHLNFGISSHMKQLCQTVTFLAQQLGAVHLICETSSDNLYASHNTNSEHDRISKYPNQIGICPLDISTDESPFIAESLMAHDSHTTTAASAIINQYPEGSDICSQDLMNEASGHTSFDMMNVIQQICSQIKHREIILQDKFQEFNNRFTTIEHANSGLVKIVTNLKKNIAETSAKFCHGDFCWCINNFNQYLLKLDAGKSSMLHSPSFYTNPWGYKMCVRANIDKCSGKEQLSLFIHLMQGENDEFLAWPFSGKMTICVLDQNPDSSKRAHIKESLETNPNLAAFKKPTTLRNHKGFGYIGFLSISELKNSTFVMYDTLVIRTQVFSNS